MSDLSRLAIKYGSDKHGHHNYCDHYEQHLGKFRNDTILLIELGIGGYHFPDRGGAGLKMWADYFRHARIAGVDIHTKTGLSTYQIRIFQGSQNDPELIQQIIDQDGRPSIVVDDASHMNNLTIRSFELLFPLLVPGGVYCVEDIESSWWEEHGFDGCRDLNNLIFRSSVNYFRSLVTDINSKYNNAPNPFGIESIHFYENLIFIHKKP
jgi:hypothetical protein